MGKLIVGMTDLKSLKTGANFTKTPQSSAVGKLQFLMPREMEKSEGQNTAGILDVNQVTASGTLTNLDTKDIAFDEQGFTGSRLSNGR